jgi:hypothetical protein
MLKNTTVLFFVLATIQTSLAGESELHGAWVDNKSGFETILIEERGIAWDVNPKFYPPCKTTYTIVSTSVGDTYPDSTFRPIPGCTFAIYKLELTPQKCLGGTRYLQFAIPSDSNGTYADVTIYSEGDRYAGYGNYSKRR